MIGVAGETKAIDVVQADFQMMDALIRGSAEFRAFLKSPVINAEKKKKVLTEIFARKVSELTMKFIILLASNGREEVLPEIIRQYYRLRDERLGILDVKLEAVVPLTKTQEQEIIGRLEKASKKKVRLTTLLNPSLKGGFTVQADDRVWDASVRHELAALRERFVQGSS
jgi:F-type H+-transporting ATPase subunit delta